MNTKHYTYRVIWSEEDLEFVGLCAEFPSLSWLEQDQEAALRGIVALVKDTAAEMTQNGETLPAPLALQKYSGKFQVQWYRFSGDSPLHPLLKTVTHVAFKVSSLA